MLVEEGVLELKTAEAAAASEEEAAAAAAEEAAAEAAREAAACVLQGVASGRHTRSLVSIQLHVSTHRLYTLARLSLFIHLLAPCTVLSTQQHYIGWLDVR